MKLIWRIFLSLLALLQIQLVNVFHTRESITEQCFFIAVGLTLLTGIVWISSFYFSNASFFAFCKKRIRPIVLYLVFGFAAGLALSSFQHNQRKSGGEKIIASLELYKKTTGEYPLSLEELKPSYLSSIPSTHWGMMAIPYVFTSDKKSFSLYYLEIGGSRKSYQSDIPHWQ